MQLVKALVQSFQTPRAGRLLLVAAAWLVLLVMPSRAQSPFVGWAVGGPDGSGPTILCTTNGQDWFRQGLGQIPFMFLEGVASKGSNVWVVGNATNGYGNIYHSGDDGSTWTRQGDSNSIPAAELSKCWAVDAQNLWVVGYNGTVLHTTNGGGTWTNVSIVGYTQALQAVTAVDTQSAWVGGQPNQGDEFAGLFHTTNGGATWSQQTAGAITNVGHLLGLAAVDAQTVWGTGGAHQDIIVTTNGGATWEQKHRGVENRDGNEIRVAPDGSVWTATDSTLFWSHNHGDSWATFSVADFTMDIDSPDGVNVWAVCQNYTGAIIYYSPDRGASWTEQVTGGFMGLGNVSMQRRGAATHYVWTNSPNSQAPYYNWDQAAHNLQDAVDTAAYGDTVLATDGVYNAGGRIVNALPVNRVVITNAIKVQSVNGPAVTVIEGQGPPGYAAVRGAYLANGAVLRGFTITNGNTIAVSDYPRSMGGGILMISTNATVSDCVITGCHAADGGGGVWGGSNVNCLLIGNQASWGGGASDSVLVNCLLAGNSATTTGGGAYACAAINCINYYNSAPADPNWSTVYGTNLFTCTSPMPLGPGNLTNAPLFVDMAGGDWRLASNSPCIDAGTTNSAPSADLEQIPRPLDGNNDGVAAFDMGVYEYVHPAADSDHDTMPDTWELLYRLNPIINDAVLDADADLMNNASEYIAGTDPANALSFLGMMALEPLGGDKTGLLVQWRSVKDKLYNVDRSTNLLANPAFTNFLAGVIGKVNSTTITDVTATANGPYFYRILVP